MVLPHGGIVLRCFGRAVKALSYGQSDGLRVSARRDHEVIFELPMVTVVDQVDAGIHSLIFHLAVGRHICAPLLPIAANEVVGLAGKFILAGYSR